MQLSSGTRKLLDDMMKDAGLNHRKATELRQFVDFNGSLPVARPAVDVDQLASTLPAKPRVLNPKNFRGGRKTASAIAQEVSQDTERNRPPPSSKLFVDREQEKQRLAMFMQYEGDIPVVKPVQELRTRTKRYVPPGVRTAASAKSETEVLQERFKELSKEVEENQTFLKEMSSSAKAGDYTTIVNGAISEKMREMQAIDKKLEQLGL